MRVGKTSSQRMRQLVDWSAAVWAGILGGLVFLLLNLFLVPVFIGGNAWIIVRLLASPLMGEGVLAPPATFDFTITLAALLTHMVLSVLYALLIAYIIHRGGLVTGIIGGALLGLAIYCINFYLLTLPALFPWFYAMRSWPLVLSHILFGAIVGGIYEGLEVEVFVPES